MPDAADGRPIGPRRIEVTYLAAGGRVVDRSVVVLDEAEARRWAAWFEARRHRWPRDPDGET